MLQENSLYIIVSEGSDKWIKKDAGPITRWLKRPSKMQRGRRWMTEHLAPGRWIGEQVSPEFAQQMNILREVHDQVENWTKDLSNALDRAQDARKLGKPLDAVFWLGQINNRLKLVADEKDKLKSIEEEHLEKYFEEHEEEIPDDYFETGKHRIVEAGILDDLGRQLTTRKFQRAHKLRLKEQDLALKKLLGSAKTIVGRTYTLLREMSKAIGSGDVSRYIQILEIISKQQSNFESEFRAIYEKYFAGMAAKIKEHRKQEEERSAKIKEEAEQRERERLERGISPEISTSPPISEVPATAPMSGAFPNLEIEQPPTLDPETLEPATREFTPEEPKSSLLVDLSTPSSQDLPMPSESEDEFERRTLPSPTLRSRAKTEVENMILRMNHAKFHNELQKAASKNDPYLLAAMMLKYSEMIDDVDPQKSLELLSIAEGILNG